MGFFKVWKLVSHRFVIWALLTGPAVWLVYNQAAGHARPGALFYWTGVLSGVFALASLTITPITKMFKAIPGRNWLIRQRRYLGLAAFGYLALHTAWFVLKANSERLLHSLVKPSETIAWISLVIFLALALTSNDWSIQKLGPMWKKLQRATYIATFLGLLHWFWVMNFAVNDTVLYGGLFVILMLYRLFATRPSIRSS